MGTDNKLCRFCLNSCDTFETIVDSANITLNQVLLELDWYKTDNAIMCVKCSETIHKWIEFKSSCLQLQAKRYVETCSNKKEDTNISSNKVCLLCVKIATPGYFISLTTEEKTVTAMEIILLKHFKEIDIDHVKDPVICVQCFANLEAFSTFTTCLVVEKKVKEYCKDNGVDRTWTKTMDSIDDSAVSKDDTNIKKEYISEVGFGDETNDSSEKRPEESVASPPTQYKCTLCDYRAKDRFRLQSHMIAHKSMSEVTTYGCDLCTFTSKYKRSLSKHTLVHKSTDELVMNKCHLCDFQTKHKFSLRSHMKIHKSSSEVTMHKCDVCKYQTRHKCSLRAHIMTHKSCSELTMYKCRTCEYQTKFRYRLRAHTVVHKSSAEVTMYRCTECAFETKHKVNLRKHMLIHKSEDEVEIFNCYLCGYYAKNKRYLCEHMKVHRSASNVVMHQCTECSFATKHRNSIRKHVLRHKINSGVAVVAK